VTDVRASLERLLGAEAVASFEVEGTGERPMLAPSQEKEVSETIRLAVANRWRLLPIGLGSKLAWSATPRDVDFVLSTRRLAGIVAYEPGDGTITARAGTTMDELERTAARGKNHLTPRVPAPSRSTLGGVLAAGQSGLDRLRYGPSRHHVLGMRAVLADGSVVKCGGRLVKNVTGYDLHRLYCGSAGSLCVVVEATLRLFAGFERERLFSIPAANRANAIEIAASVDALRLEPLCIRCENILDASRAWRVHVLLAGRNAVVEAAARALLAEHGNAAEGEESIERLRDVDLAGGRWPEVRIADRPSRIAERLARFPPETRMIVDPAIATASVHSERTVETARRDVLPDRAGLATELALRLKRSFDPEGVFAGGTSRGRA
jgi:FAD/FMN-containing dehydrogenase